MQSIRYLTLIGLQTSKQLDPGGCLIRPCLLVGPLKFFDPSLSPSCTRLGRQVWVQSWKGTMTLEDVGCVITSQRW